MLDLEEWPFLRHMHPPYHGAARAHGQQTSSTSKWPPKRRNVRVVYIGDQLQPAQQKHPQLKRHRELEDIEGDDTCHQQRKKRRLRHSFSTSRLSKPYAVPTTYIPSRKALREGIWARQRVAGRNLLRKAAALNSFSKKRRECQTAVRRSRSHNNSAAVSPRLRPYRSKSPSPHRNSPPYSSRSSTFSDFHIFDFEDDISQEDDSEWDGSDAINSDFSKLQEAEWDVVEEYGFDSASTLEMDDIYSFDPGGKGKAIGLIMENERQNEVSWAPRVP